MMRLRQLCCHRDLLPITWQNVNINDIEELAREVRPNTFLKKKTRQITE